MRDRRKKRRYTEAKSRLNSNPLTQEAKAQETLDHQVDHSAGQKEVTRLCRRERKSLRGEGPSG